MVAVPRHPNFRLLAAMNPATDAGKRDLPAPLRNRFTEVGTLPTVNLHCVMKFLCLSSRKKEKHHMLHCVPQALHSGSSPIALKNWVLCMLLHEIDCGACFACVNWGWCVADMGS